MNLQTLFEARAELIKEGHRIEAAVQSLDALIAQPESPRSIEITFCTSASALAAVSTPGKSKPKLALKKRGKK